MARLFRPTPRLLACLALFAAVFLLSGCVYLRLLEVKKQLARFDEFFSVDDRAGFAILFRKPVLQDDDVRWLGLHPLAREIDEEAERETWRLFWKKELPAGAIEETRYDLEAEVHFEEGKLQRLTLPERFFGVLSKSVFHSTLRAFGQAEVNEKERRADATVERRQEEMPGFSPPTLAEIDRLLGQPLARRERDATVELLYHYSLVSPEKQPPPIAATLIFDRASGHLRQIEAKLPRVKFGIAFPPPPPKPESPPSSS